MTRAILALAGAAALAWWLGRRSGYAQGESDQLDANADALYGSLDEPEDGVQGDPGLFWSGDGVLTWRMGMRPGTVTTVHNGVGTGANHDAALWPDPTYVEAREVAIRRGGQSSERSLEGT